MYIYLSDANACWWSLLMLNNGGWWWSVCIYLSICIDLCRTYKRVLFISIYTYNDISIYIISYYISILIHSFFLSSPAIQFYIYIYTPFFSIPAHIQTHNYIMKYIYIYIEIVYVCITDTFIDIKIVYPLFLSIFAILFSPQLSLRPPASLVPSAKDPGRFPRQSEKLWSTS